jgi:hypothetical protein
MTQDKLQGNYEGSAGIDCLNSITRRRCATSSIAKHLEPR